MAAFVVAAMFAALFRTAEHAECTENGFGRVRTEDAGEIGEALAVRGYRPVDGTS